MLEKRPVLVASLILAILVCVLFYAPIFSGKVFVSGDSISPAAAITPLKSHLWEKAEYPLWTPYIFSGMPSLSSATYTPLGYFPYIPFEFLDKILPVNFLLIHILHFLATGIFMFIFCRSKKLEFLPSLFGSIVWAFAPYLVVMEAVGHGSQMMTTAFIPIVFWAIDKLFEKQNIFYLTLSGLLIGMQFQRSHPQISYYTLLLIGLYFLYTAYTNFQEKKNHVETIKNLGFLAGSVLFGLCLAAMIYLPIHEYTPFSTRGLAKTGATDSALAAYDYATQWSLHPKEMMTFLVPSFFGFGSQTYWGFMPFTDYPNYVGIITILLGIFAIVYKRDKITVFFWLVTILALMLSWGKEAPILYKPLYNLLPFFDKFRVPSMVVVLVQFALAFLSAKGLQAVFELSELKAKDEILAVFSKKLFYVFGGMLGLLVILIVSQGSLTSSYDAFNTAKQIPQQYFSQLNEERSSMLSNDLIFAVVFVGIAFWLCYSALKKSVSTTVVGVVLCLVLVFDLFRIGFKLQDPKPAKSIEKYLAATPEIRFLKKDKSIFRILPLGKTIQQSNVWSANEISSILGYHGAKLGRYQTALEKIGLQSNGFRNMLNVKYFVTEEQQFPFPEVFKSGNRSVYLNSEGCERAFFVKGFEVVGDENTLFEKMKEFNALEKAFVEKEINLTIPENFSGTVKAIKSELQSLSLETESNAEGLLVLSEIAYKPGWKAFVDGKETEIFPTNYILQSIKIPAGNHKVTLKFELASFTYGKIITILAALLCFVALFVFKKQK
ncbi:YfhO family protein [bacterium]|nr:YfhO family protein [bacterium]